jgi:hypothetical protein
LTAKEIIQAKDWFNGPMFLWEPEDNWTSLFRTIPEIPDKDSKVKSEVQCHS